MYLIGLITGIVLLFICLFLVKEILSCQVVLFSWGASSDYPLYRYKLHLTEYLVYAPNEDVVQNYLYVNQGILAKRHKITLVNQPTHNYEETV
jgi:hypothetical protein